jgi:hypothetical protein
MNQFWNQQEMLESNSILGEIFDREFETDTQKNWYYFDAYWIPADGSQPQLVEQPPKLPPMTSSEASRLYDTMCFRLQNSNRGRGNGRLLTRCYQWFPVSSRWVPCKNVVGFQRGLCASDGS